MLDGAGEDGERGEGGDGGVHVHGRRRGPGGGRTEGLGDRFWLENRGITNCYSWEKWKEGDAAGGRAIAFGFAARERRKATEFDRVFGGGWNGRLEGTNCEVGLTWSRVVTPPPR